MQLGGRRNEAHTHTHVHLLAMTLVWMMGVMTLTMFAHIMDDGTVLIRSVLRGCCPVLPSLPPP